MAHCEWWVPVATSAVALVLYALLLLILYIMLSRKIDSHSCSKEASSRPAAQPQQPPTSSAGGEGAQRPAYAGEGGCGVAAGRIALTQGCPARHLGVLVQRMEPGAWGRHSSCSQLGLSPAASGLSLHHSPGTPGCPRARWWHRRAAVGAIHGLGTGRVPPLTAGSPEVAGRKPFLPLTCRSLIAFSPLEPPLTAEAVTWPVRTGAARHLRRPRRSRRAAPPAHRYRAPRHGQSVFAKNIHNHSREGAPHRVQGLLALLETPLNNEMRANALK
nr:regulator of hemoglobinization and erythroid cell expansion protein isoform X1 [Anser cygnoides]XP_047927091.1 regulator of hemoglobinization and erythroid cell expansion protein isoform X1 [Anser cygnoides]XP_047927092.1 regulator of hemoglobinization and erythroid cell expansion protein isoform X1 [Anser cygnoides]